jgi:DNA-binding protein HU-beta
MNKTELIDAISDMMGDKRTAAEAVNAVIDTIQETVASGDKVTITGFGVFERQERPARTARNPATGAAVKVPKTSVPKFRAGADFKALVNSKSGRARKATAPKASAGKAPASKAPAGRTTAGRTTASRATAGRATASRTTAARKTTTRKATAR